MVSPRNLDDQSPPDDGTDKMDKSGADADIPLDAALIEAVQDAVANATDADADYDEDDLNDDIPELRSPILVAAFEGWNDAGDAASGAVEHLELIWDASPLAELDSEDRPPLKKAGFLTRDARVPERKKAGLKKARKAPQYSKR